METPQRIPDRWKKYTPVKIPNPLDIITVNVPLFIRLLEYAKEDAKTDMDLHDLAEKAVSLSEAGNTLTMQDYDTLVGVQALQEVQRRQRLAGLL